MKLYHLFAFVGGLFLPLLAGAGITIQHWQTPQGSRVYFVENPALPMLDVAVDLPAGSRYDPVGQAGLGNLVRHLLPAGAGRRDEEALSEEVAALGVELDTDFDEDRAGIRMRMLNADSTQERALAILADVLGRPRFAPAVLTREKGQAVAAIREALLKPESQVSRTAMARLFGPHPYARPVSGEIPEIQKLTVADLKQFYRQRYRAGSAVISITGAVNRQRAEAIAAQLSAALPQGRAPAVRAAAAVSTPGQWIIRHPATQSHILLGQVGIRRNDPDYYALYVGNYILGGGGFSSRLMEVVREQGGLAYSVYSYFSPLADPGPFLIGLQTKEDQATRAVSLVRQVLADYLATGPTEAELAAAKSNLIGGFALRTDSNAKQREYLRVIGFYGLPLNYLEEFPARVAQLSRAEVAAAMARHLRPAEFVEVMSRPNAK